MSYRHTPATWFISKVVENRRGRTVLLVLILLAAPTVWILWNWAFAAILLISGVGFTVLGFLEEKRKQQERAATGNAEQSRTAALEAENSRLGAKLGSSEDKVPPSLDHGATSESRSP